MRSRLKTISNQLFMEQQKMASSGSVGVLLATWSFSEAICWFILPDYLLLILTALNPAKAKSFVWISLSCSILGSLVMLWLLAMLPSEMGNLIFSLPFTSKAMLFKIHSLYQTYGAISILWQPISGIPTKVWTYVAVYDHWDSGIFLGLLSVARGARMIVVATLGWLLGCYAFKWLQNYWLVWLILYTMLFLLFLSKVSG